jgi:hypothetical protein
MTSLLQVFIFFPSNYSLLYFPFGNKCYYWFFVQYVDVSFFLACTGSVHCWSSLLSNNLSGYCTYKGMYYLDIQCLWHPYCMYIGNKYGNLIIHGRFHPIALDVIYPYNLVNRYSCFNRNTFLLIQKLPSIFMRCTVIYPYYILNLTTTWFHPAAVVM